MDKNIKVGDKLYIHVSGKYYQYEIKQIKSNQIFATAENDDVWKRINKKTLQDDNYYQFSLVTPEIEEMLKTQDLWIGLKRSLRILDDNFRKIPYDNAKTIISICDGIWPNSQKTV